MNRLLVAGLALGLLHGTVNAALPGDSGEGQRLHTSNCTSCHDSRVYTRKDRHVGSLEALKQQIENCTHLTKKDFSSAQKESLVKFLNEHFYHFP
ncbi:MAG TPA: hypothetical protein VJ548_11885 [Azospira sp.]|nr:hypothetical protein [Azospira sp.]